MPRFGFAFIRGRCDEPERAFCGSGFASFRTSVNRAKARLARLSAEARHDGDPDTFLRSMQATFAHWKHGTTWRLRAQVLRELGWLAPGATPASADEESGP